MPQPATYTITDEQRYRFMASTNNMETLHELQALVPQSTAALMPCGTAVSNVYEAYEAGKKAAQPLKVGDLLPGFINPMVQWPLATHAMVDAQDAMYARKTAD